MSVLELVEKLKTGDATDRHNEVAHRSRDHYDLKILRQILPVQRRTLKNRYDKGASYLSLVSQRKGQEGTGPGRL